MRGIGTSAAPWLGVGDLARLGQCSVDAVRYYERIGLMPRPPRSNGGQRRYGENEAKQLLFIRRLRDLGFSLDEIRGLLRLVRQEGYGCAAFKKVADARAAEIRRKILQLRQLAGRIAMLTEGCAADASCGVLDLIWEGMPPGPNGGCGAAVSRRA
jgi:MerR family transcriptional regulator, mercuric resistance operon regulatory protein